MKKKLALLSFLIAGALVAWRVAGPSDSAADAPENRLFFDQLWVDHLPRNETDTIRVFAAITEEPLGIFQGASQWKGEHELFLWRAAGDGAVAMTFPQTKATEKVKYRVTRCSERDFQLCLEVSGASRGPKKYYSRDEWKIGRAGLDRANGLQLPPALRSALDGAATPTTTTAN